MKIEVNNDTLLVAAIREKLKERGGYCPCTIVKNEDTKCICKSFREQTTPGPCHCGLYVKVDTNEQNNN